MEKNEFFFSYVILLGFNYQKQINTELLVLQRKNKFINVNLIFPVFQDDIKCFPYFKVYHPFCAEQISVMNISEILMCNKIMQDQDFWCISSLSAIFCYIETTKLIEGREAQINVANYREIPALGCCLEPLTLEVDSSAQIFIRSHQL